MPMGLPLEPLSSHALRRSEKVGIVPIKPGTTPLDPRLHSGGTQATRAIADRGGLARRLAPPCAAARGAGRS
jgi:hypothetical protein